MVENCYYANITYGYSTLKVHSNMYNPFKMHHLMPSHRVSRSMSVEKLDRQTKRGIILELMGRIFRVN